MCNKTLKARNLTHEFLNYNILITHHIQTKSDTEIDIASQSCIKSELNGYLIWYRNNLK